MRIGVNGLRLSGQRFGIGRYIEYLLRHWSDQLDGDERVVIYVREPFDGAELGLSDRFDVQELSSRFNGVLWEQFVLAPRWRETDVLFCPSYTIPLYYRGRTVVATHSVNEAEPGAHSRWYGLTYGLRNRVCARRANAVIVPSETVRSHVTELYGVRQDRITIVPEGADDSFAPIQDEHVLSETRKRFFGADVPYVLFVGKFSQRRNIPALIQAFGAVKRSNGFPHKLLLYGSNVHNLPLDQIARDAGVEHDVVQLNEQLAEHRDIIPVYSAADLYVFPSLYEGATLTTVEAMACGVPVVTVNRGAVAEIVGDSALTVDEPTPDRLAAAIQRVLGDDELRASLGRKAEERSRMFRLGDTAQGTLEAIRRAAA